MGYFDCHLLLVFVVEERIYECYKKTKNKKETWLPSMGGFNYLQGHSEETAYFSSLSFGWGKCQFKNLPFYQKICNINIPILKKTFKKLYPSSHLKSTKAPI